jgi:WXXGXW repeat (2 copies)
MKHALLIAGAVALATGGSAAAQSLQPIDQGPAPSGSLVVGQLVGQVTYPPAPPPTRAEALPPPPPVAPGATAHVWDPGRWSWTGARYVWVEGRYVESPQVTAHWAPGHWQRRDDGSWAWLDGRWIYATEGMGQ